MPLRTAAASFLLRSLKHRIHHRDERALLRGGQAQPFIQHIALSGRQSKQCLAASKNCESVSPNASQIFSSEENEGVMPFWYQDEMVDCGRPERSAS